MELLTENQPDVIFLRDSEIERLTGAWLAGYLVMLTWPMGADARGWVLNRVTDILMDPAIPSTLAPNSGSLLWTDGKTHQFNADRLLSRAQTAKIGQLIVHDTGTTLRFESRIEDEDDEALRELRGCFIQYLTENLPKVAGMTVPRVAQPPRHDLWNGEVGEAFR
jgi:hypothetical protein